MNVRSEPLVAGEIRRSLPKLSAIAAKMIASIVSPEAATNGVAALTEYALAVPLDNLASFPKSTTSLWLKHA